MKQVAISSSLIALCSLVAAGAAQAQQPAPAPGAAQLAIVTIPAKANAKLEVSSPAFKGSADIPVENTQYKGNTFPGLNWNAAPEGTKSFVIIMQDPDALRDNMPILHWTMVNIPAAVTKLEPGMTTPPEGAQNGPNMRGAAQPYAGPRTPPGPKHRYHFQVFALDTTLPADALATYATLTAAMKDHVLASGETIGLGQAPPTEGVQR
ncbi:MAG: YbhB/YbcL family Raf kinase inhibitor-like protein [Longimicrobiales bacterium]